MNSEMEFKLGRYSLRLWVLQLLAAIAVAIFLFLFCDLLPLLPSISKDSCGPIGMVLGSIYFGQSLEKKYPHLLDRKNIYKVAFSTSLITYLVAITGFVLTEVKDFNFSIKPSDYFFFAMMFLFSILVLLMMYFFTAFSIRLGIKPIRKNLEDLSP